jgi:mycoredoxin
MNEQSWPSVLVYSTPYCGDCRRSKALLKRLGANYEEINIEEDATAAAEVMRLNNGRRTVPTIIIDGQTVLAEPSDRELAAALGAEAQRPPV